MRRWLEGSWVLGELVVDRAARVLARAGTAVPAVGLLALLAVSPGCGGPDHPETWEPTASWVPYGRKGGEEAPALREPDHDGDGVPNAVDRCPDLPEDVDGFRDDDGCPDVDHDGNGIPDAKE